MSEDTTNPSNDESRKGKSGKELKVKKIKDVQADIQKWVGGKPFNAACVNFESDKDGNIRVDEKNSIAKGIIDLLTGDSVDVGAKNVNTPKKVEAMNDAKEAAKERENRENMKMKARFEEEKEGDSSQNRG